MEIPIRIDLTACAASHTTSKTLIALNRLISLVAQLPVRWVLGCLLVLLVGIIHGEIENIHFFSRGIPW